MAKTRYYLDGKEIPEDEALDSNNVIRDGVTMRTSAFLRDSGGNILTDAFGYAIPAGGGRNGYVFSDSAANGRRAEAYAASKVNLQSRWKGGLDIGDTLNYGGRTFVADDDQTLRDIKSLDGDKLKEDAYNESVARMTDAWRRDAVKVGPVAGEHCVVGGKPGVWKRHNGSCVCDPGPGVSEQKTPSDREWELSGPLSDAAAQQIRDAAYEESVRALQEAWRK